MGAVEIYTLQQYWHEVASSCMTMMFNATVSLHYLKGIHGTSQLAETDLAGNGIVVQNGGKIYMLTASHVVDDCNGPENLFFHYIDCDGTPVVGTPGGTALTVKSKYDADVTRFDFDVTLSYGRPIVPIDISTAEHRIQRGDRSIFLVVGIPASAVNRKTWKGPVRLKMTPIIARESETYPQTQPKALKLVLDYDRKSQMRANGTVSGGQFGVKPDGMSGCGIFELFMPTRPELGCTVRLVAIFTDYCKQRKILIGTRIIPLLDNGMFE